jgi:replicative DNA helicase
VNRVRTIDLDWEAVERRRDRRASGELRGLRTGLGALDDALCGLHGLTVLGGAPGVGKTTLALQLAAKVVELNDVPVHWATWEMWRSDVIERLHAQLAVGASGAHRERFRAVGRLVSVHHRNGDLQGARASMVALMSQRGASTGLLVVDSLQALITRTSAPGTENPKQAIDRLLMEAAELAHGDGFAVLFISHVPKGAEGRAATFTFSGSGGIDYLVDTTAQLVGPDAEDGDTVVDRDLHIIKTRFGRPTVVSMDFHLGEHRFEVQR